MVLTAMISLQRRSGHGLGSMWSALASEEVRTGLRRDDSYGRRDPQSTKPWRPGDKW